MVADLTLALQLRLRCQTHGAQRSVDEDYPLFTCHDSHGLLSIDCRSISSHASLTCPGRVGHLDGRLLRKAAIQVSVTECEYRVGTDRFKVACFSNSKPALEIAGASFQRYHRCYAKGHGLNRSLLLQLIFISVQECRFCALVRHITVSHAYAPRQPIRCVLR